MWSWCLPAWRWCNGKDAGAAIGGRPGGVEAAGGGGGGFGIGNASKSSWDFVYTNTFKVSKLILVTAGFRSFRYKREDGEGAEALETKVSVLGPLVGVSFVF